MKTLTVRLPERLVREIESESRGRNVTKSRVIRERLQAPNHTAIAQDGVDQTLEAILQKAWSAVLVPRPPAATPGKKQKLAELIRAKKLRHR
jgi:Arc/MetJ-type ribon-helix-helix transcriptional regulator